MPRTAAAINWCGPGEFYPSLVEVNWAYDTFIEELSRNAEYTRLPEDSALYMRPEIAVRCAVAKVWERARAFQSERNCQTM